VSEQSPETTGGKPIPPGDLEFVRQEYFFLQGTVEDYQKQSLDIKKLSIGLSAGVAFLGTATKLSQDLTFLSVFFLSLAFLALDVLWKRFQRFHYARIYEIEAELQARGVAFAPDISGSWHGAAGDRRGLPPRKYTWFQILAWPHVWIPHVPIALISLATLVVVNLPIGHPPEPRGANLSVSFQGGS
jgi:hypothetical protein